MLPVVAVILAAFGTASLIGWLFLGEPLTIRRMASCVATALGAMLLAI